MGRDALLNGDIFHTLKEATIIVKAWRQHHDTLQPYASFGYRLTAPEVMIPTAPDLAPRRAIN